MPLNTKTLQRFCRSLPGVTEDIKWEDHLVFSVGGKMFVAFHVPKGVPIGFKCSEEDVLRLIQKQHIIPAPYAARFGWVSVRAKTALGQAEAKKLLKNAHRLTLEKLPRKRREAILAGAED